MMKAARIVKCFIYVSFLVNLKDAESRQRERKALERIGIVIYGSLMGIINNFFMVESDLCCRWFALCGWFCCIPTFRFETRYFKNNIITYYYYYLFFFDSFSFGNKTFF